MVKKICKSNLLLKHFQSYKKDDEYQNICDDLKKYNLIFIFHIINVHLYLLIFAQSLIKSLNTICDIYKFKNISI